jgi:hypothetical protein
LFVEVHHYHLYFLYQIKTLTFMSTIAALRPRREIGGDGSLSVSDSLEFDFYKQLEETF